MPLDSRVPGEQIHHVRFDSFNSTFAGKGRTTTYCSPNISFPKASKVLGTGADKLVCQARQNHKGGNPLLKVAA